MTDNKEQPIPEFGKESIEEVVRVLINHAKECQERYGISGDAVIEMAEIVLSRHLQERPRDMRWIKEYERSPVEGSYHCKVRIPNEPPYPTVVKGVIDFRDGEWVTGSVDERVIEWLDESADQPELSALRKEIEELKKARDETLTAYDGYISVLAEETFLLRKQVAKFNEGCEIRDGQIKKQEKARKHLSEVLSLYPQTKTE